MSTKELKTESIDRQRLGLEKIFLNLNKKEKLTKSAIEKIRNESIFNYNINCMYHKLIKYLKTI